MQIRFLAAAAPLAVGASLALTACGGSTSSSAATSSPQDAALKFARCMRAHGVNVPDPDKNGQLGVSPGAGGSGSGLDPNSPAFQNAQKECQSLLPKPPGGGIHRGPAPPGGSGGAGTANSSGGPTGGSAAMSANAPGAQSAATSPEQPRRAAVVRRLMQ